MNPTSSRDYSQNQQPSSTQPSAGVGKNELRNGNTDERNIAARHYVENPNTRENHWASHPGDEARLNGHGQPMQLRNFIPNISAEATATFTGSSTHAGNATPVGGPEMTSGVSATSLPYNTYYSGRNAGTTYSDPATSLAPNNYTPAPNGGSGVSQQQRSTRNEPYSGDQNNQRT
jgi:hypothetical protein